MIVTRIKEFGELESLRSRWGRLSGTGAVPFCRPEWLTTWWRHFQGKGELYVLQVESADGQLCGIAPWYLEHSPLSGRTIRFLGSGETCSDYLTLIASPQQRFEVSHAVAQWLVESSGSATGDGWDVLQFDSISPDDRSLGSLFDCLEEAGGQVHWEPAVHCWRIFHGATWDGYLQQLSKPHRKHMRQAVARLDSDRDLRVFHSDDLTGVRYGWDRLVALHQRRRTSLGQPGCFADTQFHSFLEDAAYQFANTNDVHLTLIEKAQEPLAALLVFAGGDIGYAYQMGTNPDHMADSPGWLLIAAAIRNAMANGRVTLDLLRGNECYKGRMGALPVEMTNARVIAPQWGARLRHTAWLTGHAVKKWLKTGLNATGLGAHNTDSSSHN